MSTKHIEFRMTVEVYDEETFRRAAVRRASLDGLSTEEAAEYGDPKIKSLCDCAVMLCDPGMILYAGCDISDSFAEESTV